MISAKDYLDAVLSQRPERLRAILDPAAEIRWPNTGERFDAESFITVNCAYPGSWEGELERVEESGDMLICAARVRSKESGASCHAVSFIRRARDRIVSAVEYWGDDGEPPEWRKKMKDRIIEQ